jgi:hypothetical protein
MTNPDFRRRPKVHGYGIGAVDLRHYLHGDTTIENALSRAFADSQVVYLDPYVAAWDIAGTGFTLPVEGILWAPGGYDTQVNPTVRPLIRAHASGSWGGTDSAPITLAARSQVWGVVFDGNGLAKHGLYAPSTAVEVALTRVTTANGVTDAARLLGSRCTYSMTTFRQNGGLALWQDGGDCHWLGGKTLGKTQWWGNIGQIENIHFNGSGGTVLVLENTANGSRLNDVLFDGANPPYNGCIIRAPDVSIIDFSVSGAAPDFSAAAIILDGSGGNAPRRVRLLGFDCRPTSPKEGIGSVAASSPILTVDPTQGDSASGVQQTTHVLVRLDDGTDWDAVVLSVTGNQITMTTNAPSAATAKQWLNKGFRYLIDTLGTSNMDSLEFGPGDATWARDIWPAGKRPTVHAIIRWQRQFKVGLEHPMVMSAAAATWMNMPAALTEFPGNSTFARVRKDLSRFTQCRMIVRTYGGTFVAGAQLRAQYSTDQTTWNYLDGGMGPACNVDAVATVASAWTDLARKAMASGDVFLRIIGINGNGTADPQIGLVTLEFR